MHKRAMTMVGLGALAAAISTGCGSDGGGRSTGTEGGMAGAPEGGSGNDTAAGGSSGGSAGSDVGTGGTTVGSSGAAGSAGVGMLAGAGGIHEDPESVVLGGTWMDTWGTTHTIDDESWTQSSSFGTSVFRISQFDNADEFLIAQNDSGNGSNAELWSRFDWTTWNGSLWYCQTTYDAASEADALGTPRADDSNPEDGGCGESGFAWTELLDPSTVGTGGAGGAGGNGGTAGGEAGGGTASGGSSGQGGAAGSAGEAAGSAGETAGGAAGAAATAGGGGAAGANDAPTAGSAGASGAGGGSGSAGAGGAAGAA
jgi:hypothetical protein